MRKSTKSAALALLDIHFSHIATRGSKKAQEEQRAYYDGMRLMLEHILTEYCTRPGAIIRDENGHHIFTE